jgi:hypothetical protein
MDPTIVFCPNLACPARGHVGQGNYRTGRKIKRIFSAVSPVSPSACPLGDGRLPAYWEAGPAVGVR